MTITSSPASKESGPNIITQTVEEWHREGEQRFGEDERKWAFKCPMCGHVATVQDFIDAGGHDTDPGQKCIGRVTGKGVDGLKDGVDKGDGCNWAAFGLFHTLGKGLVVVMPDGHEVNVFDFADVVNSGEHR